MHQDGRMTTEPDWARLGQAIRTRMSELRLSYRAIREIGGPSQVTVTKLIKGNPEGENITPETMRRLEESLRWEEFSIDDLLAGRDARPKAAAGYRVDIEPVETDAQLLLEIMNGVARLPEKDQREVLALIRVKRK